MDKNNTLQKYGYRVVYVEVDPKSFGKEFNDPDVFSGMSKIKESIKQHGIIWPLCATYKNGFYDNEFIGNMTGKEPKIGHGFSRLKAAIDLGINVPVIISDFDNKFNDLPEFDESKYVKSPAQGQYTPYGYYYDIPSIKHRFGEYGNDIDSSSVKENLAICGCSWASDLSTSKYSSKEVTNNSQLWQYNLGYDPIIYASPGSTNLKIYVQVQQAIENGFDNCLVFLTSPTRINISWNDSDGWSMKDKFIVGRTDVVNEHATKETQEYIAKYYNEELETLNSFVIVEAIYWKLKQTGKPFYIFTNAFTNYIHKDWEIFDQKEIIKDGPVKIIKDNNYLGQDVPNHLSIQGQNRAKNLVLSYINKKG